MRKIGPVLMLLAGLATIGVAVAAGVGGFANSLSTIGQPWVAPGSTTQELSKGSYTVYVQGSGGVSALSVQVTGPAGEMPVSANPTGTLTLGTTEFSSVAGFTAPQDGSYTITVDGDGQTMVVGPELGSTIGKAFMWVAVAVFGGILVLAGAIWLIVALVSGSRNPQPAAMGPGVVPLSTATQMPHAQPAAPVPGSWYPDPEDPEQLRWWDGRQWTDERRPRN